MKEEIWRSIASNTNYAVSTHGRVKRAVPGKGARLGKILKSELSSAGYPRVRLSTGTRSSLWQGVHRLVAAAFIPNPENKLDTNHINYDRADNYVENLEWCTKSENMLHCAKRDSQFMKKRPIARVDVHGVPMWYESACAAGRDGFSQGNIANCLAGKRTRHGGFRWCYAPT